MLLLGWVAARSSRASSAASCAGGAAPPRAPCKAIESLVFYALLALFFLLALRSVNIPLTAFTLAGGALAVGIGFGSQTILNNFISGLILLTERPIQIGDIVEIDGMQGAGGAHRAAQHAHQDLREHPPDRPEQRLPREDA